MVRNGSSTSSHLATHGSNHNRIPNNRKLTKARDRERDRTLEQEAEQESGPDPSPQWRRNMFALTSSSSRAFTPLHLSVDLLCGSGLKNVSSAGRCFCWRIRCKEAERPTLLHTMECWRVATMSSSFPRLPHGHTGHYRLSMGTFIR